MSSRICKGSKSFISQSHKGVLGWEEGPLPDRLTSHTARGALILDWLDSQLPVPEQPGDKKRRVHKQWGTRRMLSRDKVDRILEQRHVCHPSGDPLLLITEIATRLTTPGDEGTPASPSRSSAQFRGIGTTSQVEIRQN